MLPLPEARFSLQGLISSWDQSYDVASFSCPHLPGEDTGETSSQAEALAWLLREMHPPHPMLTLYLQSNPESQIRGSSHIPRAEEYTWDSKLPGEVGPGEEMPQLVSSEHRDLRQLRSCRSRQRWLSSTENLRFRQSTSGLHVL